MPKLQKPDEMHRINWVETKGPTYASIMVFYDGDGSQVSASMIAIPDGRGADRVEALRSFARRVREVADVADELAEAPPASSSQWKL